MNIRREASGVREEPSDQVGMAGKIERARKRLVCKVRGQSKDIKGSGDSDAHAGGETLRDTRPRGLQDA